VTRLLDILRSGISKLVSCRISSVTMSFFRRPFSKRATEEPGSSNNGTDAGEVSAGSLQFVSEKAGNDSGVSYQEASGAPVETNSPLGYNAGPFFIIFLNVGKMIGTGVYSTPSSILKGTGSVGLSMIWWALGFVTSATSLAVYLEYMAYFPNRSGSEVVYLEQAFPRPRYFFPTTFAFQAVVLSFSSSNAIGTTSLPPLPPSYFYSPIGTNTYVVLARYLYSINGHTPTDWQLKGVAIAGYTVVTLRKP
jgi:hypothetical protein